MRMTMKLFLTMMMMTLIMPMVINDDSLPLAVDDSSNSCSSGGSPQGKLLMFGHGALTDSVSELSADCGVL